MTINATVLNGASQATENDITMAEPETLPANDTDGDANGQEKKDVKLEDLFADVDSDEEFPSSRPQDSQDKPSSPQAPLSPMYVPSLRHAWICTRRMLM